MKKLILIACTLCCASLSCTAGLSLKVRGQKTLTPENHIIRLNEHGNLETIEGDPFPSREAENQYMRNIMEKAYRHGKVLIFIHGGLNGKGAGSERFRDDAQPMMDAGYYPIFIVWPSGILSTYGYHLIRLRPPERSNSIEKGLAIPLNLIADLGRAVVRSPLVNWNLIENDWSGSVAEELITGRKRFKLINQHEDIMKGFGTNRVRLEHQRIRLESDQRGYGEMSAYFGLYVLTFAGKLVTAPFIDAFGRSGWQEMNARLDRISSRPLSENDVTNSPAALPRFFDMLEHDHRSTNITLVGHSMGAILINKMLPDYKAKLARVVFLAAACSIDDFERGTLRYLEKNPGVEFFQMTLHPAAESREIVKLALDLTPRGSLLVWIDEFLDPAQSSAQRRLGKWANFYEIDHDTAVPFLKRMNTPALSNAWTRGFGVGSTATIYNGSSWNRVATTNPPTVMKSYPQTHHDMGAFTNYYYWSDEFLLNRESKKAD